MSKANAGARHKKNKSTGKRPLCTEAEAAEYLGVSVDTLRTARCKGTGVLATIPWFKYGDPRNSPVRYDLDYIERVWLPRRMRSHGEPGAA